MARDRFARWTGVLLGVGVLAGCGGGDGPTDPDPDPTTSIRATVTADGDAQAGVTVRLFNADAASARATSTTDANGISLFNSLPLAAYDVEITVPEGFDLAAGQTAKKRVSATTTTQASVTFALEEQAGSNIVTITAAGTSFSPATVTIDVGTTVRWVNGGGSHTVTPDGHSAWARAVLNSGQMFEHTFNTAGTFAYYCEPHRDAGMTGTITVQ